MSETNDREKEWQRGGNGGDRAQSPRRHATEREELIRDPNRNQAGNERGSLDQTQGSQTGSDIDPIPEP